MKLSGGPHDQKKTEDLGLEDDATYFIGPFPEGWHGQYVKHTKLVLLDDGRGAFEDKYVCVPSMNHTRQHT